jgi:uroporphyrin-III C-methyltransferase
LLTLHALNALRQADVIIYDALVDARIMEWARKDAEMVYAGKRGGKPSAKQRDISLHLVDLAKAGKRVIRLFSAAAAKKHKHWCNMASPFG